MDNKIKIKVKEIQKKYVPKRRIEERIKFEDQANEIIKRNLGRITKDHLSKIIEIFDSDWKDKSLKQRFGLLFWGNRPKIIANDPKKINLIFLEVYDKENLDDVEILTSELKGISEGFVSCIFYLKNREKYNIFIPATTKGIQSAFPEEPEFAGTFKDRYIRFNKLANKLKKECNLEPQEIDLILTVLPSWIGETEEEKVVEDFDIDVAKLSHSDIQGILVELGNLLGYKTYVADPSKPYKDKKLKDFATLGQIPQFTYPDILQTAKKVDVIWFAPGHPLYPTACFEVEHTTNITNGLLRLYGLKGMGPKFFIIAQAELKKRFESQIKRPPFYEIKDRYLFRRYDELIEFFELANKYYNRRKKFL